MWQYATLATNGVTQGDYATGKATFMAYLRAAQASPGKWLAEDCARKSHRTVIQVSLMPWYLSESSNTRLVESPIMYAHRRLYTSRAAYMDLVQAFAYELITTADWTGRVRYWEGPISEPQRYWRGSLAQLSQLYRDFAQAVQAAEVLAASQNLSTGSYKVGGSSTAAWWMAITVTDSPPGPLDGPDPGPPSPLVEINRRLIVDHVLDPATPLDFLSWHQVGGPTVLHPDDPYPGLPESGFAGRRPGWCSTAMRTTRAWVTAAGGDPDRLEYILTEWYNGYEGVGTPAGLYAAVAGLNSRANIARNDLGGRGFELATRTAWEDWANVPVGDNSGPGMYHKVGRYPKPLMTLHQALHKLGAMPEVHVEFSNYNPPSNLVSAAIHGRAGGDYMVVQGSSEAWTLQLRSARLLTVTRVTRMDGSTPYPGRVEASPPPSTAISIPAAAWEVLIVEYGRDGPNAACVPRNGSGINPVEFACVTRPVVGAGWTTSFHTNATTLATLLGISSAPASGIPIGVGELLIAIQPPPILLTGRGDITLMIPSDPSLPGAIVATQGFRIDTSAGTLIPLNAQDLTLGF